MLRTLFSAHGLVAIFDIPWVVVYVAVIWLCYPLLGMATAGASARQNAETVMQFGMVDAQMERWRRLKDSVAAQRSPRQARATRPSLPA